MSSDLPQHVLRWGGKKVVVTEEAGQEYFKRKDVPSTLFIL
jgi:hypothetical protein